MLVSVYQHAPDSHLTWVGRMPCLIPVLCVPVPMTPAAATSETAPKLGADEGVGEDLSMWDTAWGTAHCARHNAACRPRVQVESPPGQVPCPNEEGFPPFGVPCSNRWVCLPRVHLSMGHSYQDAAIVHGEEEAAGERRSP